MDKEKCVGTTKTIPLYSKKRSEKSAQKHKKLYSCRQLTLIIPQDEKLLNDVGSCMKKKRASLEKNKELMTRTDSGNFATKQTEH